MLSFEHKLVSHLYLKRLEIAIEPSFTRHSHAILLIERIVEKINGIKALGKTEEKWVIKAEQEVKSGEYHTDWRDYILLLDSMV